MLCRTSETKEGFQDSLGREPISTYLIRNTLRSRQAKKQSAERLDEMQI
jgi:hypothetical protein